VNAAQVADRAYLLMMVDLQECDVCAAPITPDAAADPTWVISSEGQADGFGEVVEMAIILCPDCSHGGK